MTGWNCCNFVHIYLYFYLSVYVCASCVGVDADGR